MKIWSEILVNLIAHKYDLEVSPKRARSGGRGLQLDQRITSVFRKRKIEEKYVNLRCLVILIWFRDPIWLIEYHVGEITWHHLEPADPTNLWNFCFYFFILNFSSNFILYSSPFLSVAELYFKGLNLKPLTNFSFVLDI